LNVDLHLEAINNLKNKLDLFSHSHIPRLVATTIYADIKEKFVDEKDVKGNKFAPLKHSTIRQKERQHKIPYKILRDTGQLLNSLNYSISGNSIKIGYSVPYAKKHQHGTKHIAQRKILPTDNSEIPLHEINSIITEYFL
jgi:phage gpG-like protein